MPSSWTDPTAPGAATFGVDEARVDRGAAAGQAELMDVEPFLSQVPMATVEDIAAWWVTCFIRLLHPARGGRPRYRIGSHSAARDTRHGAHRRARAAQAVRYLDHRGGPAHRTAVLFLNSGRDPHTGPNRMWVELSHAWAALGFPCYRFDLSGLGDSPMRAGQVQNLVRAPEAFDDMVDVVHDVIDTPAGGPADGAVVPVVLAGLCAGAYQALESAIDLHPVSVLSINPLLRFQPPELESGPLDPRRKLCKPVGNLRTAYRSLPSWKVLRVARNAYLALTRLRSRQRSPLDWLEDTAAQGTDVLCVCGEVEAAAFFGGSPAERTTLDDEHCRIQVIEGLDHGLMLAHHRAEISDLLTRHLTSSASRVPVAPRAPFTAAGEQAPLQATS